MTEAYDGRQVVGIDLHRRRSVIVRMTEDGRKLETVRITNSPAALRREIAKAGSTRGWSSRQRTAGTGPWTCSRKPGRRCTWHIRWASRPSATGGSRTIERDAADLADLLRMGRLPEAWIAPPEIRELRELTRYRHKLVKARTSVKDQVHGVLAKLGVPVTCTDIFGVRGQHLAGWPGAAAAVRGQGRLAAAAGRGADRRDRPAGHRCSATCWPGMRDTPRSRQLPGIGPVLAAVIVAEIGDIRRFPGPGQLGCWAGLTPRHYESDTKVIRGHVTKQGSRMLRWAVVEAIQRQPAGTRPRQVKDAIIARRGKEAKNIAKVAAARELLTLVFYGMRDGHVRRALQRGQAA